MLDNQSLGSNTGSEVLGRYELVKLLGEDMVARTFLARPLRAERRGRWVALKVAHPQLSEDPVFRRAFRAQARIGLALKHPNIVRTFEVVADPGQCYSVTEFLRGRVLSRLSETLGPKLDLEFKLGILQQVLAGLSYVHEFGRQGGKTLGLLHRNLTPACVFVGYDGRVRLLDCGLSRVAAMASARRDNPDTVMRYSAPEQCLGKAVDARTDLYAVGVMLWEAMVGMPRQFGNTLAEMLDARVHNREPSIERVWPEAPPYLAFICRRALAFQREDRYSNAFELSRAIAHYLQTKQRDVGQAALGHLLAEHCADELAELERALAEHSAPKAAPAERRSRAASAPAERASTRATVSPAERVSPTASVSRSEPPPLPRAALEVAAVAALPADPEPAARASSEPPPLPVSASAEAPAETSSALDWARRAGPSTLPVALPSLPPEAGPGSWRALLPKLALGAAAGTLVGVLVGVVALLASPSTTSTASAGPPELAAAPTSAPVVPEPSAEATASAEPSAAPPAAASAEPAAVSPVEEPPPAKPSFVVKVPEPLPPAKPRGRFVVKEASEAGAADDTPARTARWKKGARGANAKAARRKRGPDVALAAPPAATLGRAQRPIDDADPYQDHALLDVPEGAR